MTPSRSRFVTACQQLLALAVVLAVLTPAASLVTLDVVGSAPVGPDGTIFGGSGDDVLIGTHNGQALWGQSGADTLRGQGGRDLLKGGAGADTLNGGPGKDTLLGDDGNDTFVARDGKPDYLDGRGGTDKARADAFDHLVRIEETF